MSNILNIPIPGTDDADPDVKTAFQQLALALSVDDVQRLIRCIRNNDNGPAISEFLAEAAAKDVKATLERNPNMAYLTARLIVARKWGYEGNGIFNFNKIADRGWYLISGEPPTKAPAK